MPKTTPISAEKAKGGLSEQGFGWPLARFDRSIDVRVSSLRQKVGRLAEEVPDATLESGPRATFLVESAAVSVHHGGVPALRDLMEEWRPHGDVEHYAVDARNRPVGAPGRV